jgi:hypothetical protein
MSTSKRILEEKQQCLSLKESGMTDRQIAEQLGISISSVGYRFSEGKYHRQYHKENREKIISHVKLWKQNNPDKEMEYRDKYKGYVHDMNINDAIIEIENCILLCTNCHKKIHRE